MRSIEELYEWAGDAEDLQGLFSTGKPQWFSFWALKYADALDIENIDYDLDEVEKEELFRDVGVSIINALLYFKNWEDSHGNFSYIAPMTRDGRILSNALKRDIDQAYIAYYKRKIDGKKGGRPPKNEQPEKEPKSNT